jgi:hypothetical protein
MADGRYWLSHDAQDIDDTIGEVQDARGSEASLSARLADIVNDFEADQQRQDAEISAKATVSDIYGIPSTSIVPAEGTTGTLAAYTTPGTYIVPTGTAASRLTDTPISDKGFIMEVRQYRSGAYYRQTIYAWNESNAFYTRSRTGGANWTAWFKFEGTQVAVSAQSAPASLMQAGRIDASELTAENGETEGEER